MARLLAILCAALFLLPGAAQATLVVAVPSADGLVIAADSRMDLLGAHCDGEFKITELRRPARTVVMVTGDPLFVAPPPPGERDLCRYLATAPRMLDVGAVVARFLDQRPDDPAQAPLDDVAAACVHAVERFRQAHPEALRAYSGRAVFSVVLASYDPAKHTALLRNFVVRVDAATGAVEAARLGAVTVGAQNRRGVWMYGETEYVEKNVFAGAGRRFLAQSTLDFVLVGRPVAACAAPEAAAAAVDVIQAASRTTQTIPAPSGIGGPIRVVLLGRASRPVLIRQAKP